ncbi:murein transglycosylase A [Aquisediminimonas sediminicola]|uniref:murein transglycosylase A n=1 Tax=Alteraquisediminimonas sediminicola TaxID=2676787 RepID=UPI003CCEB779
MAAMLLSACAGTIVPASSGKKAPGVTAVSRPKAATPKLQAVPLPAPAIMPKDNARSTGVRPGQPVTSLAITDRDARAALSAFRLSCPSLTRRTDTSGLTQPADWRPACIAASGWSDDDARAFFTRYFESAIIGDGNAFATGYYEPEIAGSRVRAPGYGVPIYRRPPDLVDLDLGQFSDSLKGKKIRGRVAGATFVPYADRAEIVGGALAGRNLEIAWAADEVEFFFLQVQGSGRLRLPDGSVMRIGYESQNGRDYSGIGKLMKDRGLLGPGQSSMQGIVAWLRAHPEEGRAIMNENRSFVFFREVTGAGPLGALGVQVVGRASVAADPAFIPLGAPLWLWLDRQEASGLWVAQDTGGAIKGPNRVDTFWGAGIEAEQIAGGMSGRGQAQLLLPIGTLARLTAGMATKDASAQR